MAEIQISIKDRTSATQWLSMVGEINEAYYQAMEEAAQTLEDMQNFADGTIVDELVQFGTDLCNAAQRTFDAIKEIADLVNRILDIVDNFKDAAMGFIEGAANAILG